MLKCPNNSNSISPDVAAANAALREFARRTENVEYFDANAYLCPNGVCSAFASNGLQIYYNAHHIRLDASWKLGQEILQRNGLPEPFSRIRSHANQLALY